LATWFEGSLNEKLRNFISGPIGKLVALALVFGGMWLGYTGLRDLFGESRLAAGSRERVFMCTETGKPFEYTIKRGDVYPVPSPHSGKNTGYPAEICLWTADGKIKSEPTYVLLNQYANKKGATFCPDCGRLVVPFNPRPSEGDKPPPKESEYKPRRGSSEDAPESIEPEAR
jgi:hypothetical protein